jgi:putative transposase
MTKYNYTMLKRKVTYRLYPNAAQEKRLHEMLIIHQRIYNEALEARIKAYRDDKCTLSFADQCKTLTVWRKKPHLSEINAQSLQVTLKRLDLAFQAFFRRVKLGQTPGFPRFKSIQRFPGWGYKTHGDGFRLFQGKENKHGKIRLSGIGLISLRGKARTEGPVKTCEILHKASKWYVSVTIECHPKRGCGKSAVGFDWGVETFVVMHNTNDQTTFIDNPRHLKKALPMLKILQQSVSRKKNKKSNNRKDAIAKLAKAHAKLSNQRKDFQHQLSAKLINQYGLIACETLSIKNMIKSGGTYKRGLNREILSTAPTQFHSLLKSKAEEAGALWIEIPTREIKPTQTCYQCYRQYKKSLSERIHRCDCGVVCNRDENSARVILNWALKQVAGQELAELGSRRCFATLNQETPAIP